MADEKVGTTMPVVIVIAGPTAVGKTSLAIHLARQFQTEIISADARQCYREMNIGTAKPSPEELQLVKHHFINSHSIQENVTAFDFEQYALEQLTGILKEKGIAIVCGGTGLYINALCDGLDKMPDVDEDVARSVNQEYRTKGLLWLQQQVKEADPLFFNQAEQQNPVRLLRALAFVRTTGQSILQFRTGKKKERPFRIVKIAVNMPRPALYHRINQRVDQMIAAGLVKEVEGLLPFQNLKSLQTVGYSELFPYFKAEITLPKAVEKIKQHTRNYAKRQLTWFKRDPAYQWFDANAMTAVMAYVQREALLKKK